MSSVKFLSFAWSLFACGFLCADISLPGIFSDHMVLQQNSSVKIWGTAKPNEKLNVKFNQQNISAQANNEGKWSATIKTQSAGGPFELEIAADDSDTKVRLSNIMVGEVWICAGGSKLHFPVAESANAELEIEAAKDFPLVRQFRVESHAAGKPLGEFYKVDPWTCCSSDSVKEFSIISHLVGKAIYQRLDVPIGLIQITQPSATLESWIPQQAFGEASQFQNLITHWKDSAEPNNPRAIGTTFNGMIAPLQNLPIAGVIMYEGENNLGRGAQFRKLLPVLIKNWRKHFGKPDTPFFSVQLPPHRYADHSEGALPEIWDAQLVASKTIDDTGLVVTLDLSPDRESEDSIPSEIAERLANHILGQTYRRPLFTANPGASVGPNQSGENVPPTSESSSFCGPLFKEFEIRDGAIWISFTHAEAGLKYETNSKESPMMICGSDQKFKPAVVEIVDNQLRLFHPDIKSPAAVRYAWSDTSQATLTNTIGLPAAPFRTDDFQLPSEGIDF